MKSIKYLVGAFLLVAAVGCEYNEDALPVNIDTVVNNNGGYLRIIEVKTGALNVAKPYDGASSIYNIVGELYDSKEGDLVTEVAFYVRRTGTTAARTIAETANPFKTIQKAAFARGHGAFGDLPRAEINITLNEVRTALGFADADVQVGDIYRLRWVVKLSNGKSFTNTDVNPAITGAFFSSPYAANSEVVLALDPDKFIGNYTFVQRAPSTSVATAFADGWIWEAAKTFSRSLAVNPNNRLTGRTFSAQPLKEFNAPTASYSMSFTISEAGVASNRVTLGSSVGTGLGCGGVAISYGASTSALSNFDQANDNAFVLVVSENVGAACGQPRVDVIFDVTKN